MSDEQTVYWITNDYQIVPVTRRMVEVITHEPRYITDPHVVRPFLRPSELKRDYATEADARKALLAYLAEEVASRQGVIQEYQEQVAKLEAEIAALEAEG